jgi:hypothetical protein
MWGSADQVLLDASSHMTVVRQKDANIPVASLSAPITLPMRILKSA